MNEKNKNLENKKVVKKKKRRRLKWGYVFAAVIIFIVMIMVIKLILPSGSSKYGDRLDGIKKITFGKTEKNKIVNKIKDNDKVTEASVDVKGKIIYVLFDVKKDTSKDDAKSIANDSLSVISDEVKNFYDINYVISKKDEEGTKKTVTNDDGETKEVTVTVFPLMGYKNSKSKGIVW